MQVLVLVIAQHVMSTCDTKSLTITQCSQWSLRARGPNSLTATESSKAGLAMEACFSHPKALQALGYNQHPQPLSARVFTPQDGRAEAKGLEGKARQVTKKKGQGKQFLQRNSTETHFLGSHQAHGPPQAVGTGGRDRRRTRPRQPAHTAKLLVLGHG